MSLIIMSDHHIVSFIISHIDLSPATAGWRLNDSLLTDPDLVAKMSDHVDKYFHINNTGDSPPTSLWVANKVVIWGQLIALATEKKRRKIADLTRLTQELDMIYHLHSQNYSF